MFSAPVSRWKSPRREDILKQPALEIVADSEEAGPNMMVEAVTYDRGNALSAPGLYSQPSGYETTTLAEYLRDAATASRRAAALFPKDDPAEPRQHLAAYGAIYINWMKAIYEATP